MADLQSAKPIRKVMSGGLAAAVVTVIVAILEGLNYKVAPELAAALTTIVGFLTAYMVPGAAKDFVTVEHGPVPHGHRVAV